MSPKKNVLKREAAIRTIPLAKLRVSPLAQREAKPSWVAEIADNLDMEQLGTLTVSFRDGYYWIIDGQHRYLALKEFWGEGWEEWEIQAWTYFGLTEEEEAEKFLQHNDVRPVDAMSRFEVGVTAGRAMESDIHRIVLSLGLKVSRQKGEGCISAVSALTKAYQSYGAANLAMTLSVIRDSFGDQGYESVVLNGMSMFLGRWDGLIDLDRLTSRLRRYPLGVKGLLNDTNRAQDRFGGAKAKNLAATVTDHYNKGLKAANRIDSWWKESA